MDELFRIAGTGRQVRHEHGRVLDEQGVTPEDVQFLLDGSVHRAIGADGDAVRAEISPPAALAFDEVMEGAPSTATVTAVDRAICLALRNEQVLALLAENAELVHGFFRMAIERDTGSAWRGVLRGFVAHPEVARLEDGLQAVEKILLVEEMPVFARASAADIQALALAAREAPLTEGATLVAEGDVPAIYVIVSGEVALEPLSGGEPLSAGPGDTFGVYETLSGSETTAWRVHVTRGGLALRVDREVLFDVLADRIELLQAMFSAVLRRQTAVPA